MTFGVTEDGFNSKRLADVIEEAETDLALIVDPISGESLQPDFSSDDPAMQVALVPLVGVADSWEATKLVFDQFSPSLSVGPSLSGLVQINGIERIEERASTDTVILTGSVGATIPAGSLISDEFLTQEWSLDIEVTIGVSGTEIDVPITNTITGPVTVSTAQLDRIVTPVAGWQTVSNEGEVTLGRDEEQDQELRIRRNRSTLAPAAAPAESVWANLRNLEGVTYVRVLINNSLADEDRGTPLSPFILPAKNQAVIIEGGDDIKIAETILQRSGAGVEFFGTTTLDPPIFDAQGEPYEISFTRPAPINIFVKLEITVTKPNIFPGDVDRLIKDAIIAYAESGADALGALTGFNQDGFGVGSLVVISRLYTPVNSIAGHKIDSLEIGLSAGSVSNLDLQTSVAEFPKFTDANIDITVNF